MESEILSHYTISTDEENVRTGDNCIIIDADSHAEFDNIRGEFEPNLYYYYIVDLKVIETDTQLVRNPKTGEMEGIKIKRCKVEKVHEKSY